MEYRQVVAVTGLSGLYQLMSTKNDGAIVRSLVDNSVKFVSARVHHITPLESIEIYTINEQNIRLHEVFEKIMENDAEVISAANSKDDKAARSLFATILPEFDNERVYTSDIKKIYKWYVLLKNNNMLNFEYLKNIAEESTTIDAQLEPSPEANEASETEKPKAKAKKSSKKVATEASEVTEEEPAKEKPKKTAAKKATKKKED